MAKLLVVEDDRDQNLLTCLQLKRSGYNEIKSAYSGEEALQSIATEMPDLILLDIMMPDINGIDLVAQIRNDYNAVMTPIIALTGCTMDEDIDLMLQAGFDDVATKPVEVALLVKKIQGQLAQPRVKK